MSDYTPVQDLDNPHIKELAEWTVAEYNKEGGYQLALSSVVKCESQIVAGVNYRFILTAKDENDNEGNYEAVIWEKVWDQFRKLISFQPLLT
ncbi:hypothetical protein Csa_018520 [Cucumis sativus]|nr:hypothetical protein Csa_018520 [Cucumis sativus]